MRAVRLLDAAMEEKESAYAHDMVQTLSLMRR
jgi:hypothetical protein